MDYGTIDYGVCLSLWWTLADWNPFWLDAMILSSFSCEQKSIIFHPPIETMYTNSSVGWVAFTQFHIFLWSSVWCLWHGLTHFMFVGVSLTGILGKNSGSVHLSSDYDHVWNLSPHGQGAADLCLVGHTTWPEHGTVRSKLKVQPWVHYHIDNLRIFQLCVW